MKRNKRTEIFEWMMEKRLFSTSDIRRWGVQNFYSSCDRVARKFAEDGLIRRISDQEARSRGLIKEGNALIAWYECNKVRKEDNMSHKQNDIYIERLIEEWNEQQFLLYDDAYCHDEPAEAYCAAERCEEIEKELLNFGIILKGE